MKILQQVFKKWNRAAVAAGFFGGFDAAQLQKGRAPRLLRIHASAQIIVDVQLEITIDLCDDFPVPLFVTEQTGSSDCPGAEPFHAGSSEGDRKRARIAVVCSQSCASF